MSISHRQVIAIATDRGIVACPRARRSSKSGSASGAREKFACRSHQAGPSSYSHPGDLAKRLPRALVVKLRGVRRNDFPNHLLENVQVPADLLDRCLLRKIRPLPSLWCNFRVWPRVSLVRPPRIGTFFHADFAENYNTDTTLPSMATTVPRGGKGSRVSRCMR